MARLTPVLAVLLGAAPCLSAQTAPELRYIGLAGLADVPAPPAAVLLQVPRDEEPRLKEVRIASPEKAARARTAFLRTARDAQSLLRNVKKWRDNPASAPASWKTYFGGPDFPKMHVGFWADYQSKLEHMVWLSTSGRVALAEEPKKSCSGCSAYVKCYGFLGLDFGTMGDVIYICPRNSLEGQGRVRYWITEFPDTGGPVRYSGGPMDTMFHELSHLAGTHDGSGDQHKSRYADSNAYAFTHLAHMAGYLKDK